jgi:NADH-quinone oxidoreductase subunit H
VTAVASRRPSSGRIALGVILALVVLGGLLTLAAALLLPPLVSFLGANQPLVRFIVAAALIIVMTIPTAFLIIYMELKVIARMNLRVGPDRVGPWGAAQSVIHGFKVLSKEDFTPYGVDVPIFTLAPVVVFLATIMSLLVVPFAPGLFGQDYNIGLLYFFAIGGLTVVGLMMAGWASFNKYSLLGALRAAAQAVSYEIPLTLSVVGIIILAGTMSLNAIVQMQAPSFLDWNIWKQPIGFIIFFIAATAEANRTPADMTEADQELVGGFATEYSGMRFGFFFFAEYVNVFVVSAVMVVLFFGGWQPPVALPISLPLTLDPGSLGIGLLAILIVVPVVGILVLAGLARLFMARLRGLEPLVMGLVLFVALSVVGLLALAYTQLGWAAGLLWMMGKTYVFVFIFVQMRATFPRIRVDQLMSFAWKWLLPASLLNIFATAVAVTLFVK